MMMITFVGPILVYSYMVCLPCVNRSIKCFSCVHNHAECLFILVQLFVN